jgi:hypothetical protein
MSVCGANAIDGARSSSTAKMMRNVQISQLFVGWNGPLALSGPSGRRKLDPGQLTELAGIFCAGTCWSGRPVAGT